MKKGSEVFQEFCKTSITFGTEEYNYYGESHM
jgi:hypothetical protein